MKEKIKTYLVNKYNEKGKKMVGLEYISYILANYKMDNKAKVIHICEKLSEVYDRSKNSISSAMNLYVSNVSYMSVKEFLIDTYEEIKREKII